MRFKEYFFIFIIIIIYFSTLSIVKPWGEFPLNDDWVYARDCVLSARAGHLVTTNFEDAWTIPQLVGGSLAARFFGFSSARSSRDAGCRSRSAGVTRRTTSACGSSGLCSLPSSFLPWFSCGRALARGGRRNSVMIYRC